MKYDFQIYGGLTEYLYIKVNNVVTDQMPNQTKGGMPSHETQS